MAKLLNTGITALVKNQRGTSRKVRVEIARNSMIIKNLVVHLAEFPSCVEMKFNTEEIDFGTHPYQPTPVNNSMALQALFEE
jgi:formylmethanofuran dehydrogenase subunit E